MTTANDSVVPVVSANVLAVSANVSVVSAVVPAVSTNVPIIYAVAPAMPLLSLPLSLLS